jgi:predicted nucleic acid-binding protein
VIFIDTGAFLARYIERDQHYADAIAFWNKLAQESIPCYTSNLVLSETLTLLGRRASYDFAAETARNIYASNVLHILRPDANDEIAAITLLEKYAGQKVSFCDCVSFVLMGRLDISDAFTFDRDFSIAGFKIQP